MKVKDISIPDGVVLIRDRVASAGGKCLLVGGAVVDAILGRDPKDWDIEVHGLSSAKLEAAISPFAPKACGKSFGIFKLDASKLGGVDVDVSIPRTENSVGVGHKDFEVSFDPFMTPRDAAERRDFTINAMFMDLDTGDIVDPFGGLADLEAGVLRMTSPEKFKEDPVRALRAVQLVARKAKTVDPDTQEAIMSMADSFDSLAKERVFAEWEKLLLKSDKPSVGLNFLRDCGWLQHFPELEQFAFWDGWELDENKAFKDTAPNFMTSGCPQNMEWHPEGDVWVHNNMVVDAAAKVRHMVDEEWRLAFMMGAMLHDVAKPITTVLPRCTAHGHDVKGEALTRSFMERITNNKKLTERVVALVCNHLQPFMLTSGAAKPAAWKRLHKKLHGRLDILGWMSRSDWAGRPNRDPLHATENGKVVDHPASVLCWKWHEELGVEEIKPILLGRHLIKAGHKPGPMFKGALGAAFEKQLDCPDMGIEELLEVAERHMGE